MALLNGSLETKLALGAALLLAAAIAVSALGERTLPLFGGDRELAARVYKSGYLCLGGGIVGLAMPALITWFLTRIRAVIGDGALSGILMAEGAARVAHVVGFGLLALFVLGGVAAAVVVWVRGG